MIQKLFRKVKQNRGFTMMEMLIAVSIMVVLLSISIVSVTNWSKSIKMTELDNYAKTIYLEAQNQLASLEVEGGLSKLTRNLVEENGTYYADYNGRKLADAPKGYIGDYKGQLYYFYSLDNIMDLFIPEMSLSVENGTYVVELNPATGDVYGVFYWENDNENMKADAEETQDVYKRLIAGMNRDRESRSEYEIGYYCGDTSGESLFNEAYELDQKVEIVNGEELYVKISYNHNESVIKNIEDTSETAGKLFDVQITIVGETSGYTWTPDFNIKGNYRLNETGDRIETGFLLDGLLEKQKFVNRAATSGLIPGEDLSISVKTVYQHGDVKLKEQSPTLKTNSLFYRVTECEENGKDTRIIEISSIRHLSNLGSDRSSNLIVEDIDGNDLEVVRIKQVKDIDLAKATYAFGGVDGTIYMRIATSDSGFIAPSAINPIKNEDLLVNHTFETIIDGDEYVIKNLKVNATADNAGLFGKARNVVFKDMRLEDYTLNASTADNVGALVGNVSGGSITNCGVYLSPSYRDASGTKRYYNQEHDAGGNVMTKHYQQMYVHGGTNVGGLVGYANSTVMKDCFAAVRVEGSTNVGGLIGNSVEQKNVTNSYASGDVDATNTCAGGFVGKATGIVVDNAYASGDTSAKNSIGGFVGVSAAGTYTNAAAYGEVSNNTVSAGGFISALADNNVYDGTIGYLRQVGYNAGGLSDEILAKDYSKLVPETTSGLEKAASYPYDRNLLFKAFPFQMVTSNHYGDWPLQYFINNSLVYYERYSNGDYGYYSVTKLTDATNANSDLNKYVWVLDSLQDRECVEDGYALLSMFYLESVDYTVHQYVDGAWNKVKTVGEEDPTQTLHVTSGYTSDNETSEIKNANRMVLLEQQGTLEFLAYEGINADTGQTYNADYSNQTPQSSFVTNGMYLYQLPYQLQNTDRKRVDNFYDVIVFDKGYAVGNTKNEDDGEAGGTPVISKEVFYYCPHFAKLAINPGIGASDSATNFVQLAAPYNVSVRSARQLNALGRVPYYWNQKAGGSNLMTYQQEVDINFSSYTQGSKKYCGEEYNLLAFDTQYANQPIGQRESDTTSNGAFQNDYNGNYHKITDYCVKSSNQYVGLFGEIYKAGGTTKAQIRDVVMLVSNPNNTAQYDPSVPKKDQNNAGLIISDYQEKSNRTGSNRQRTGVGALVGSDYTIGKAYTSSTLGPNEKNIIYTIYNCASTGYRVQYHIVPTKGTDYQQPLGIAIGGMIGYSRGNVAHSAALNDVKLVAKTSLTGDNAAIMIGGFSGSSFCGTTLNCYAGGTIDVETQNGSKITRLRIGGFCPGWLDAPGINGTSTSADVSFINVYSYAEVQPRVFDETKVQEKFTHLMPTVSRMRLYYENRIFSGGTKWHTDYDNGDAAVSVPGFSYYLNTVITNEMLAKNEDDAKKYYEKYWSLLDGDCPKTCDAASYEELSDFAWVSSNAKASFLSTEYYKELTTPDYVVPYSKELEDKKYSFPAFVMDKAGNYVHYGDWPYIEMDTDGELFAKDSFKIGFSSDNMKTFDLNKVNDTTYSVKFKLSGSAEEYTTLQVYNKISGFNKVNRPNRGNQLYLSFSKIGSNYGKCSTSTATSGAQSSLNVSLKPDTEYVLYLYHLNLSNGENNDSITWKIVEAE